MARNDVEKRPLRIVLAGNPNSGKTSLFNALTGANQHVGNYPGITVEKKEGRYDDDGCVVHVIDLPGTYSLAAYSPEERIARREIMRHDIDVVVVVVDATNLDRNLYLFLQVLELGANAVLALNMSDEAAAGGQRLDVPQMRALLGVPIVETIGHKAGGVAELREAIRRAAARPTHGERVLYGEEFEATLARMADVINPCLPKNAPSSRWWAIKTLEEDPEIATWLRERAPDSDLTAAARGRAAPLVAAREIDGPLLVADNRYAYIAGLLREVRLAPLRRDSRRTSDMADAVLCHRLLGIPIFLGIMYVIFWLTFTAGEWPMRGLEAGIHYLASAATSAWPGGVQSPLRSLLVDGVLGGVGGVLVFLPNIMLLFFGLSLLEDTGYMARAAFLMDRFMHRLGLHGKSFVPLLTGFGCSIPGLMACRTLDNERDRLTTMLVLPLMSCGARLPIYLLLIPAFFAPHWRAPMLWLIYFIGIALAVTLAKVLRVTILAGEDAPFVMELPPYRLPTLKAVVLKMGQRAWMYLRKAGTIILAMSIVMWAAASYPKAPPLPAPAPAPETAAADSVAAPAPGAAAADSFAAQAAERQLEHSVLGRVGKFLSPAAAAMGGDWRLAAAAVGALPAKELFVAQLGIVFSLGQSGEAPDSLRHALTRSYSPLQGFCIMLFMLIAAPCAATLVVMGRESGAWKWAALQFGGLTALGWLLATLVYQIGRAIS